MCFCTFVFKRLGIWIGVPLIPYSLVSAAPILGVGTNSAITPCKSFLKYFLVLMKLMEINLFFQISGSHCDLIFFLATCVTWSLGGNVILSSSGPILIVLKFIWNKLFSWLFDHRLRFQFFVWECACTWIKISTRWCKWKRCNWIKSYRVKVITKCGYGFSCFELIFFCDLFYARESLMFFFFTGIQKRW